MSQTDLLTSPFGVELEGRVPFTFAPGPRTHAAHHARVTLEQAAADVETAVTQYRERDNAATRYGMVWAWERYYTARRRAAAAGVDLEGCDAA